MARIACHIRAPNRRVTIPRYGFTGSRYFSPIHGAALDEVLTAHMDGSEYTTGGAVGVDTYVLRKMTGWLPDAHHRVCLPEHGADWDNEFLSLADEVIRVPNTMDHPWRSRNAAILDHSDILLAFPLHDEDHGQSKRSGTWMTIRMARERDIPIVLTVLDQMV